MRGRRHGGMILAICGPLACSACTRFDGLASPDWITEPAETLDRDVGESVQAVLDAAESLPRPARIIPASGRCVTAKGGEPDCQGAAVRACQAQGYAEGRAADVVDVRSCRFESMGQILDSDRPSCRTKYRLNAALCW